MAEKIVSPGVFTREVDQSFLPAGIAAIGAAVIGPTVKGPALVPTQVSNYSEYQQVFGDTFTSGSGTVERTYSYLTSYTAKSYLAAGNTLTVVRILAGSYAKANSYVVSAVATASATGPGSDTSTAAFRLHALAEGAILNSGWVQASANGSGSTVDSTTNNALLSGSAENFRWEIANVNESKGTFGLYIRRGDDTIKRKLYLEQWNNLSLDPNSPQYISKVIGDQVYTLRDAGGTSPFLQVSGSYPNKSKYVRVEAIKSTYNYLDSNGNVRVSSATGSLPAPVSGTFSNGSDGNIEQPQQFYQYITDGNSQGYDVGVAANGKTSYEDAINLLSNQDEYDINVLSLPGILNNAGTAEAAIIAKAVQMCEDRGDCFTVVDPTIYGSSLTGATTQAEGYDSSYAAMYYPWLQIYDSAVGNYVWVPPSTLLPGVYAFNDQVAAEWFAPAGLNRGGLETVIQAERKLTHANRDTLYDGNINPIATFPNSGVVVYGQKTLQRKASALDRINVRRLLIAAKKFIASATRFLVFEQNTSATRNRFLNIVNPYLESVQQRQGLYAFRVVMDETNNTPDVIDRNQMVGQIFLQPTKTAEFIIIDFNILPTGAAFPE